MDGRVFGLPGVGGFRQSGTDGVGRRFVVRYMVVLEEADVMTNLDKEIKRVEALIKEAEDNRVIYAGFTPKEAKDKLKLLKWHKQPAGR